MKTAAKDQAEAQAIERVASEWLLRCENGQDDCSTRALAAWRKADPRHEAAFSRLVATAAVLERAQRRGDAVSIVTQLGLRARRRRGRRIALAGAAAFVVLLLGINWGSKLVSLPAPSSQTMAAAGPLRQLPDGSLVELNFGAAIDVRYEAAVRRVVLQRGEAHFSVTKDATRPFIVVAAGVEVRAVGTAFTVDLQSAAVEIVVTEGRIALDRVTPAPTAGAGTPVAIPAIVEAGHRARLERGPAKGPAPEIIAMSGAELGQRLAWRKPRLEFNNLELAQAVALMNRHNRLQIVVAGADTGRLRVSGTFLSDNPEGFVRIVESTFDLKAERRGENQVVLRAAP
jgi:transmembrane sensor